LKTLEISGQYSRAAAIAVFCLEIKYVFRLLTATLLNVLLFYNFRLALKILQNAGKDNEVSPSLRIVAVALSGFNLDNQSMWRESVTAATDHLVRTQLKDFHFCIIIRFLFIFQTDPYIRAMFAFLLTASSHNQDNEESYYSVLNVNSFFNLFSLFKR